MAHKAEFILHISNLEPGIETSDLFRHSIFPFGYCNSVCSIDAFLCLMPCSFFSKFNLKDAFVVKDLERPERSRGFGLLKFFDEDEFLRAQRFCDGLLLKVRIGSWNSVELSQPYRLSRLRRNGRFVPYPSMFKKSVGCSHFH